MAWRSKGFLYMRRALKRSPSLPPTCHDPDPCLESLRILGGVHGHVSSRTIRVLSSSSIYGDTLDKLLARQVQDNWLENHWRRSVRLFASAQGQKINIVVPAMGESVSEGSITEYSIKPGDHVNAGDVLMQIETDKVTLDVRTDVSGAVEKILVKPGDTVKVKDVVAVVVEGDAYVATDAQGKPSETKASPALSKEVKSETPSKSDGAAAAPAASSSPAPPRPSRTPEPAPSQVAKATEPQLPPKERERRVPMTMLRKRVATRLKDSQNTFALLTTFNEIDMTNLMELRSQYNQKFLEKHGLKLGFMSCFVKAAVSALQQQPVVNAVIDGDNIIYRDYVDISIAVGTKKGLVVPVVRNVEKMNFAEIEKTINELATKANNGTISIDEMAGGTFTISNGGVYGSLLSTPIINPPQSAILGMHTIQKRPMVVKDSIVARPMMYIALTYDHRLIDGREAVYFLGRIKEVVEDPRRLLLDV
ncbi:hypothetical protein GOP47_0020193 [Adiantum capillus-veneris]|uniref:dihydrolipoyllysine-residue succinyltransferase n=1 Tax=Adiantum capillus-veneris TaxID=13818 RepID=A0A9D4Z7S9_ADICA|nr:hypothetical protein GOP47_0020193 [Adiantum capillus-veneris]